MPSTTALYTAMTGLNANARNIDVIGNNIANVNTTAFKSARLTFSTLFSRTMSGGTAPGDTTGGTNPFQIGMGANTAGTQRNTNAGTISGTGDGRDLAIDGKGYFVVDRGGAQVYTRAGAFRPNARKELTTISGETLRGFAVDDRFNLVTGRLVNLSVPVGALTIAEATTQVRFAGNLNADGDLPTQGSRITLGGTATGGLSAIATAAPAPTAPNVIESTTRLVDVEDPALPGSGTPLFTAGQVLEMRSAEKGGKSLPNATLAITATTTLSDVAAFLSQAMGIESSVGANPDGNVPGVSIDPLTGLMTITGNTGIKNDLVLDPSDLRLLDSGGTLVRAPFSIGKSASADGESIRTTFVAYDSLGTAVECDITATLESRGSGGTTWRYFVESADAAGIGLQVATGTMSFDDQGQPVPGTAPIVSIDRTGSGAATPLAFELLFGEAEGGVTSLTDTASSLAATFRDGSPIGTLSSYGVGTDGLITGVFSNGLTRTLGQVVLATFSNPEGLDDVGGNLFREGRNSGTAVVAAPGQFGSGKVVGGALEQSNVDLSEEFIKLVQSSTGFSASSRVIQTTDQLMQQLLTLGR